MQWNRCRVLAVKLMTILSFLLVAAFLSGIALSSVILQFPDINLKYVNFPLSTPCALTVEQNGNIVVASGFYGRIQVYSVDGRFLSGFFYAGDGGNVRVVCNGNDQYLVFTARGEWAYLFSGTGKLLSKAHSETQFSALPNPYSCQTVNGAVVHLRNVQLNPRVVVTYTNSTEKTIISNPLPVVPFVGPIAPWACLVLLAGVRHFILRKGKDGVSRKHKREHARNKAGTGPDC